SAPDGKAKPGAAPQDLSSSQNVRKNTNEIAEGPPLEAKAADKTPADKTAGESGGSKVDPAKGTAPSPAATPAAPQPPPLCTANHTIKADVVAMPQPIMLNRLGAAIPDALIFALKSDTVTNGNQIQLRPGKRPRPLVLRANIGQCLRITFTNAIPASTFTTTFMSGASTGTTEVSLHIQGVEWVQGTQDDGSFVGVNNSSLASVNPPPANMPPSTQVYTLYAKEEGVYLMYTMGDTTSQGQQLVRGLFGSLNIQPADAEWYRSQVTADDLLLVTYNANNPQQVPPGSLNCTTPTSCTFNLNG